MHLDPERKNLQSTQEKEDDKDFLPPQINNKQYEIYTRVTPDQQKKHTLIKQADFCIVLLWGVSKYTQYMIMVQIQFSNYH